MGSKPQAGETSEELRYAMEALIRIANKEDFAVVGFLLRADPPCVTMLRNTKDDPAEFMRYAADMIDKKRTQGLISEERVAPYVS